MGRRGASGRGRKPAPSKKETNSAAATTNSGGGGGSGTGGGGGGSSSSAKKANNNNDVSSEEETSEVSGWTDVGLVDITLLFPLIDCRTIGPRERMRSEGKRRR